jgi:hypothetical protein
LNPSQLIAGVRKDVQAFSTTYVTLITTPWQLIAGGATVRSLLELQNVTGNFGAKVCLRTAAVRTSDAGAWSQFQTTRSANGTYASDIDLTATTDAFWAQLGLAVGLTSGTAAAEARALLAGAVQSNAHLIASAAIPITPSVNSGESAEIPVGPPLSALGITGLVYAFSLEGVAGSVNYGAAYRTFDLRADKPGAWNVLTSHTAVTADETWNTGVQTVTVTDKLLLQPAVTLGGTSAQGTLRVLVAALTA